MAAECDHALLELIYLIDHAVQVASLRANFGHAHAKVIEYAVDPAHRVSQAAAGGDAIS